MWTVITPSILSNLVGTPFLFNNQTRNKQQIPTITQNATNKFDQYWAFIVSTN